MIKKHIRVISHYKKYKRHRHLFESTAVSGAQADEVRKFQAAVYLAVGNVSSDQIDKHGFLDKKTDGYVKSSQYFAVREDGELVGGARMILPNKGYSSLQISKEIPLDKLPPEIREAARKEACCEMSGLVKGRYASSLIPLLLIKTMYQFARTGSYDYILMSISDGPYQRFKKLFGKSMIKLADSYKIPHGNNKVHPCAIHVETGFRHLNRLKQKFSPSAVIARKIIHS